MEITIERVVLERIAQDAGVEIDTPLCSDARGPADSVADSYAAMMRHNAHAIVVVEMMGDSMLQVDSISVFFRSLPTLRDVSFTLTAPQRVGVVSPNGSGKSTLCVDWPAWPGPVWVR